MHAMSSGLLRQRVGISYLHGMPRRSLRRDVSTGVAVLLWRMRARTRTLLSVRRYSSSGDTVPCWPLLCQWLPASLHSLSCRQLLRHPWSVRSHRHLCHRAVQYSRCDRVFPMPAVRVRQQHRADCHELQRFLPRATWLDVRIRCERPLRRAVPGRVLLQWNRIAVLHTLRTRSVRQRDGSVIRLLWRVSAGAVLWYTGVTGVHTMSCGSVQQRDRDGGVCAVSDGSLRGHTRWCIHQLQRRLYIRRRSVLRCGHDVRQRQLVCTRELPLQQRPAAGLCAVPAGDVLRRLRR